MSFDVLRDRVQMAISRLEKMPDRDSEDLAQAVAECLRQVQGHSASAASYVDVSYEMLETL